MQLISIIEINCYKSDRMQSNNPRQDYRSIEQSIMNKYIAIFFSPKENKEYTIYFKTLFDLAEHLKAKSLYANDHELLVVAKLP